MYYNTSWYFQATVLKCYHWPTRTRDHYNDHYNGNATYNRDHNRPPKYHYNALVHVPNTSL